MWACPRSRSTVITRSFEQLEGCTIIDEPFLTVYASRNRDKFTWDKYSADEIESDPDVVIAKMTGPLPPGARFSFQKISTDQFLPDFGYDWMPRLTNFFLLRHPAEIIVSLEKALRGQDFFASEIDLDFVGIKTLANVFHEVRKRTGKPPLVVDSGDILREPESALRWICDQLGIEFDQRMLRWKQGLVDSALTQSPLSRPEDIQNWYGNVAASDSFRPISDEIVEVPAHLKPVLDEALPFYEELLEFRQQPQVT